MAINEIVAPMDDNIFHVYMGNLSIIDQSGSHVRIKRPALFNAVTLQYSVRAAVMPDVAFSFQGS